MYINLAEATIFEYAFKIEIYKKAPCRAARSKRADKIN